MNPEEIGHLVRFHRKKAGLSQEKLGFIAGLGKTVVFDIEKGKLTVRLESLLKILKVLNIHLNFQSPLMSLFEESLNEKS
jgi:y4mF family transcriptional regulator